MRYVSYRNSRIIPNSKSRNPVATIVKNYQGVPHSDRSHGANGFSKTADPATRSKQIQKSLHSDCEIADTTTTSSALSTRNTTSTLLNEGHHPHSHANDPPPAPGPFAIRQTVSAYPNMDDPSSSSLNHHRSNHSTCTMAEEPADPIAEQDGRGVCLQDPTHLLHHRKNERSRRHQKFRFSETALVYEYELGGRDMPMRPERTKFHDDDKDDDEEEDDNANIDESQGGGFAPKAPWPRNGFPRRGKALDDEHYRQTHGLELAKKKKVWYDSVKKECVRTKLENSKDVSGREEKMREKAMAMARREGIVKDEDVRSLEKA